MSPDVISVSTADGPLPGEFLKAASPPDLVVVFAHGAGAGHRSPFMRNVGQRLATAGADVLTFDFPYMAAGRKIADRPPVLEAAFLDAVDAAVAASAAGHVVLAGKSMGGRMATHLAARPDAWRAPVPLAGVVAFGYPLRPPGPRGGDRVSHLRHLAVPTLLVQGTRDSFGGPGAIADDVGPVAHLTVLPVESGDHSLKVRVSDGRRQADVDDAVVRDVMAWMRGRLRPTARP
ncbi:MAG: alpha/beta fold hydrolase [Vicinamibacterales bacterium]